MPAQLILMAMTSIGGAFLIFGGILFIGYFGEILAKKFSVPSALLLLIIGYLLRLSGHADVEGLVGIQELFGTLALIVLLFEGGLSLNLNSVIFKSGRVLLMSVLITILAVIASALFFKYALGTSLLAGAIFGALAGGIGSTTTISILKGLKLPKEIENFLTLESSITDVFSIILTIVFTQALVSGAVDFQIISQGITAEFSAGLVAGVAAGVLAIIGLSKIEKGYNYMITFAIILLLFSATEFVGGSGAIAVLVFGIVFGNNHAIRRMLRLGDAEKKVFSREFQSEISFFIRTFFFVFLGAVVTLGSITNLAIAIALTIVLYALRYASIKISTHQSPLAEFNKILIAINPRGLATAVLATYPVIIVENALKKQPTPQLQAIHSSITNLPEIAFYVIILTIIATTILVPIVTRAKNKAKTSQKTR